MRFMQEEEAEKTMNLFEGACEGASESKGITKKVLKNWVVRVVQDMHILLFSLLLKLYVSSLKVIWNKCL